jgi:hypothetical protein
MHKHCGLDKWKIWDYTLPQITELMKRTNKFIEFEVNTRANPFAMFGGGSPSASDNSSSNDSEDEYQIATEDSINELARILGGA